jgi:hypothetical protein
VPRGYAIKFLTGYVFHVTQSWPNMKYTVFCIVTACSMVEVTGVSERVASPFSMNESKSCTQLESNVLLCFLCLAYSMILKIEVIFSSETMADFCLTIQCYIPEDRTSYNFAFPCTFMTWCLINTRKVYILLYFQVQFVSGFTKYFQQQQQQHQDSIKVIPGLIYLSTTLWRHVEVEV